MQIFMFDTTKKTIQTMKKQNKIVIQFIFHLRYISRPSES